MGININGGLSYLLLNKHSYKDFADKKILMLGVQQIRINGVDFIRFCKAIDFELSPVFENTSNKKKFREFNSYILFEWMGFKVVEAMDVSDYEGADIICDLNMPIKKELYDRYDYIYDGGTLEHVFDVRRALENICKMLKIGGMVVHDVPAAKQCNHGFYTFSPTLVSACSL